MRNVILLHAREDAVLAEALMAGNPRVALICAVDLSTPPGRFGPQFHLAALWSSRAASARLEWLFADLMVDRDRESILLTADDCPIPTVLRGIGRRVALPRDGEIASLFEVAAPRDAIDVGPDPAIAAARAGRRRSIAAMTTTALSLGCGALLAHAASPHGLIPSTVEPTYTPTARIQPVAPAPAAQASVGAAIDDITVRYELVRAAALQASDAPAVRARFETVQALSVSDAVFAKLAGAAERQAEQVFAVAPKAQPLAAASLGAFTAPSWAAPDSTLRLAAVDVKDGAY